MSSKKIRFLVRSHGELHQLFSVSQTSNGDVQLFKTGDLNGARGFEKWENMRELKSRRISIHRSLGSKDGGITIKYTTDYINDHQTTEASYVKKSSNALCWPIISVLCPDFTTGKYKISRKSGDKYHLVSQFDLKFDTLIYHVVVTEKNSKPLFLDFCNAFSVNLRWFDLHIYTTFLNRLPTFVTTNSYLATSMPKVNGIEESGIPFRPPTGWIAGGHSLTSKDLEKFISTMTNQLSVDAAISHISRINDDMHLEYYYMNHQTYFSKIPQSFCYSIVEVDKLDLTFKPGATA